MCEKQWNVYFLFFFTKGEKSKENTVAYYLRTYFIILKVQAAINLAGHATWRTAQVACSANATKNALITTH